MLLYDPDHSLMTWKAYMSDSRFDRVEAQYLNLRGEVVIETYTDSQQIDALLEKWDAMLREIGR